MTDDHRNELYKLLAEARDLSVDVVDFVQEKYAQGQPGPTASQTAVIKAALGIAFTTLCKATDTPFHDVIDMVMTIYKNTEVIKDDE